ncbi:MAG: ATP-binding protein [Reichenbachiella sp.]
MSKTIVSLFIFFLIWLSTINIVLAQIGNSTIKFENLSNEQGLSQASVSAIVQDQKGFIWIGTNNGLNKYDGYDFKVYQVDNKEKGNISDNSITSLMIDQAGVLWVGTKTGGVNRYNEDQDKFDTYQHTEGCTDCIGGNFISHIFQDSDGIFWISANRSGLTRWDQEANRFDYISVESEINPIENNHVKQVFEDSNKQLWLVYDRGLIQYDFKDKFIKNRIFKHVAGDDTSLPTNYVKQMLEDSEGKLWIGSDMGISLYLPETATFKTITNNPKDPNSLLDNFVKCMNQDDQGNIWIGTDQGISIMNPKDYSMTNIKTDYGSGNSLLNNYVKQIYIGKDQTIWVATDGGVSVYDKYKEQFGIYQHEPFNSSSIGGNIYTIYQDVYNLWIGSDVGLYLINNETHKITRYQNNPNDIKSLSSNLIKTIYRDSNNTVWLGTDRGLNKVVYNANGDIESFKNYDLDDGLSVMTILDIVEDHQQRLWITTWGGGVNVMDLKTEEIHYYWKDHNNIDSGLDSGIIWQVMIDSKGGVWVVSDWDINLYDESTDKFKSYTTPLDESTQLNSFYPTQIFESNGELWIGTNGAGLMSMDLITKKIIYHQHIKNLEGLVVYAMQESNDHVLWMGTNDGIVSYNPETGKSEKYGIPNGLQGKQFNMNASFKNAEGVLYFGGPKGLNFFDPSKLEENTNIPEVYITEFSLLNKLQTPVKSKKLDVNILNTQEIELEHWENTFSFKFVGLNFRNTTKNQFKYMLEGFDPEWVQISQSFRFANYTQVPPGEYIFRVIASNDDGYWNKEGASLKVIIHSPWWKTVYAYIFYICWIILNVLGVYYFRIRQFRINSKRLAQQVKEKTQEVSHQNELLEERNYELSHAQSQIEEKNNTLSELNATLEQKVKERTKALQMVVNELKEHNINLEQFNYIISHNMRAPVANIVGLLNLYNHKQPEDTFNKVTLKKMHESCNKLDEVLKDLTSILEVQHQIERPKEKIVLEDLIDNIKNALKREIDTSNANIETNFEVQYLHSIPALWYSILINLISNAIKYRKPDQNAIIKISTNQSGQKTMIIVEDNGIGIDMKLNRDKVFGLYNRFHTHVEGKGMGLFMVKTQVESLGGKIEISSQPDQGTRFNILV